jgi:DNA-binding transcriptional MocR family regulator
MLPSAKSLRVFRILNPKNLKIFVFRYIHNMVSKKQINLLRGWPNPSLLPQQAILCASQTALSDPAIAIPGLLYGPDPGYQPLREEIARWMQRFYGGGGDSARICITGGASQNLACMLQVFTDPVKTKVWMVAPCYFLACGIFRDAGLGMGAVPEGKEGVDLEKLEELIGNFERGRGETDLKVRESFLSFLSSTYFIIASISLLSSCLAIT